MKIATFLNHNNNRISNFEMNITLSASRDKKFFLTWKTAYIKLLLLFLKNTNTQ